ncbi:MAG TPA: hypothetical protein ACFCUD_11790 [Cyclobacteriaceae bacterium]
MDNIEILIYLIFGIIYFLSRAFRKKRTKTPQPTQATEETQREKRPASFEELLEEFTSKKDQETEEEDQDDEYKPVFQETSEREKDRDEKRRPSSHEDAESKQVFEDSIKEAKRYFQSDDDSEKSLLKDKSFDDIYHKKKKDNKLAKEIRNSLRDPNGARKAIIYSEILKRRY